MPNHVSSSVSVTGDPDQLAAFRALALKEEVLEDGSTKQTFDFNAIIPMPEGMAGTVAGGWVDEAMWALGAEPTPPLTEGPKELTRMPWAAEKGIIDRETALTWLKENHPEAITEAERQTKLKEATGHYNWHGWSCANWGTKWNAYGVSYEVAPDSIDLAFQTAWDFPEPVFWRLTFLFPKLRFSVACHDEGWNFSGEGVFNGRPEFKTWAPAVPAHYALVHGRSAEFIEDDE